MKKIRISIVQPSFKGWDFDHNFTVCEELVSKVLPENPDLICLPELFPGRALFHSHFLSNLKVPLFFGHSIPPKKKGDKWKNSYSLHYINRKIKSQYKLKMTDAEIENNYEPGEKVITFLVNGVRTGVSICHSFAFDDLVVSKYLRKIDLMIVPSLAPFNHIAYWKNILLVRSIDLRVPIIFINYAGKHHDHGIISGGGNSSIVLPLPSNFLKLSEFVQSSNCSPRDNFLINLGNEETTYTINLELHDYVF